MMFEARGAHKHVEEDVFEKGCIPPGRSWFCDMPVYGNTIQEILAAIRGQHHSDSELELDACGDIGRVDVACMETDISWEPTEADYARWKRGEQKLWYAVYSYYIERVTREPAHLTGAA